MNPAQGPKTTATDLQRELPLEDRFQAKLEKGIAALKELEKSQGTAFTIIERLEALRGRSLEQIAALSGGSPGLYALAERIRGYGFVEFSHLFGELGRMVREGGVIPRLAPDEDGPLEAQLRITSFNDIHRRLTDLFIEGIPDDLSFYEAVESALDYLHRIDRNLFYMGHESVRIRPFIDRIAALGKMDGQMMLDVYGAKDVLSFAETCFHEFGLLELRNELRKAVFQAKQGQLGRAA